MLVGMRVLVTNDDGIDSPGLLALAERVTRAGHEVVVAAPAEESSGSSAALQAVDEGGRIQMAERRLGSTDTTAFAVSATPAFIVLLATRGAFGPEPDVVLAGINRGANTGAAVLHSGTVGAALTAVANGCPALAVSLDVDPNTEEANWDTAAEIAVDLLPMLTGGFALNVNVPDVPAGDLRGVRRAHLAEFGIVQMTLREQGEGFVRMSLEQVGDVAEPGSDDGWLLDGYAAVTPLFPPGEAADVELPGIVDTAGEHIGG
ncbi:5'/3'-nucleotidase SurE [Dactylosporangium matsuzakiense]|uniref:5'-nucleotidase n=2 Tax=Dactylosporangium matsuzakiense TaxID=53360 RepID=A0A9W6KTS3_9ACTN|nr:5'/3'-nucleotidase SurE [Dactylosporangium matsuzakiense]GLL06559.1 5'/3'-nucleotidase SurE [Dactylosporangium matsuzakiense]